MANEIELGLFIIATVFVLGVGGAMSVLSYNAYRRRQKRSLMFAVIGFVLITLGGIADAVYELGIKNSFRITERGLMVLHTADSVLVGIGLAVLFYALSQY